VDDRTLPFRLIEQSNAYVGAARNAAARTAHGDWLAFLDDDDIAQPDWLSTLRSAAAAADADVVTCMIAAFSADGGAADQGSNAYQWLALGNAPELGFFVNVFGAYCALYRAAVFQALGGFVEVRGVTFEDYALLSRASLTGFRLEYVARPLVRYREHASTHIMGSTSPYRNRLLGLKPYLDAVPESLRPMLLFAHGHWRTSR
jgi:GT2 family glycosyltransferase